MSYAEKNLAPGEAIVYRARYHWIYYRLALALLLVAAVFGLWWWITRNRLEAETAASVFGTGALVLLVAAGVVFVVRRIRAAADEYVVTNRRVIRKYGLIAREAEHVSLEKIQDVTIRQGIAARLLGYGTVVLETASETGRIVFADIARPESFRGAIWGQGPERENAPAASPGPAPSGLSAGQRLAELEDLRTRGLLTTEEYAAKRAEILRFL
jgi:membrane protein YdbS with pleckstrin-like domain